ncbi:MAG: hypothetical protein ACN4GM_00175 [Gammaproteobacteria bacterium]
MIWAVVGIAFAQNAPRKHPTTVVFAARMKNAPNVAQNYFGKVLIITGCWKEIKIKNNING